MIKSPPWIAVVDDEAPMRRALLRLLHLAGMEARAFASGAEFIESLQSCKPGCVVLDLHMPGMTGFEVQSRLAQHAPEIQVIIVTGQDSFDTHRRAMLTQPIAYLCKPMTDRTLLDAIELALQQRATILRARSVGSDNRNDPSPESIFWSAPDE